MDKPTVFGTVYVGSSPTRCFMLDLICPHCNKKLGTPLRSGDWLGYNSFTCDGCKKVFFYALALGMQGNNLEIKVKTFRTLTKK